MKSLDAFIKNIVTKEINEPQEYATSIKNAFNTKTCTTSNFKKITITVCSFLILISGIVYATDIKEFVSKYFYNFNEGVDTAIENGYFDEPEMNYTNSENIDVTVNGEKTNPSDVSLKVKDMVMDDHNLVFTIMIKLDKKINISNIMKIKMDKMLITDENNKIIFCGPNKNIFDEYCKENNLNYEYLKFNDNYMCSSWGYVINNKNKEENIIEVICNFNNSDMTYPKSKKLNIQLFEILMSENENVYAENKEEEIKLDGNWNIQVDVNDIFYNRKVTNYKVKNCNYNDINVTEAILNDTCFSLKFNVPHKHFYLETDSEELKKQKIYEYRKYYTKDDENVVPLPVINSYIENEYGKKFYQISSGVVNQYNSDLLTSDYLYWKDEFALTKADQTDTLKIYFTLNLPDDQRNVCIELEKKS